MSQQPFEQNMIVAGFGGQGVLFTGKVIAYCGLIDGRELSWLPSYGPEMRGGTANCSVCLSDRPIGSPLVTQPDILVAMNAPSYEKFIGTVKPGGLVVYDSTLISPQTVREDVRLCAVPATRLSNEESLTGIANIILLGKLLKESAFTSHETVEAAIHKCVPARKQYLIEHNLRAIRLGCDH